LPRAAAVDHLEKAARQGHTDAQLTLGYLAARGYGMKQDMAEAKLWWTLSAARGNEHAARAATLIEPSLNSQELIKSRRLVSEWRSVLDEPSTDPASPSAPKKAKIQDAVAKGDMAELRALVARGEDADGRDIEGRTALINASWRGDPMMVDSLLEFGADPDVYDKGGRSAINWASSNGHAGVVEKLIKSGVEVDVPDGGGRTALIRAVINGHTDVVKALVAGNANLGTKDKDGMTAADYAKKQNYADILQVLQSRR
jgi:uncharacterized protein